MSKSKRREERGSRREKRWREGADISTVLRALRLSFPFLQIFPSIVTVGGKVGLMT